MRVCVIFEIEDTDKVGGLRLFKQRVFELLHDAPPASLAIKPVSGHSMTSPIKPEF